MKTSLKKFGLIILAAFGFSAAYAEEPESSDLTLEVGGDVVSSYIWRGQELGGASFQPSLSLGWKGLSLSAWGSVGFESSNTKEFDLTLGYEISGFSVSITDYYFAYPGALNQYFHYGKGKTAHVFEAQLGYDFGFMSINWYTNFAGDDAVKNAEGDKAYSSYLSLGAPFTLGGVDCEAELGFMPWKTDFYANCDGFSFSNISVKATKPIKLSDEYELGFFTQAVWNPKAEGGYIVLGMSF
ncbi:MAG: hypothetical protein MJ198_07825 [Bacteroidales bacterium]|nr:hypothetical protein [Bacteroidales bacterium]